MRRPLALALLGLLAFVPAAARAPVAHAAGTCMPGDTEIDAVEYTFTNGTISVAGSLNFPLSDFGITAPSIGGFIVSIEDNGTLEFLVNFTKN